MGGRNNDNFIKFKKKCVDVYLHLRNYSRLILNLFHLMLDSGIKDLSYEALEKMM